MRKNPLLRTDSYKLTHYKQYPKDAQIVYSYLESRGGDFPETVFFGLQYYLQEYMQGRVFNMPDIHNAREFAKEHFGVDQFNFDGWVRLFNKYGGKLPLRIRAVPEGTVVPTGNVLMTVENTDPEFYWLTNFWESLLLKVWYSTTVATLSRSVKKIIKGYLEETGDPSLISFKLHDFGYRGASSEESASIGGSAHLINFLGSDTLGAIELLRNWYSKVDTPFPGFSIPASEHSTMTSWGRENEVDAIANMLEQYPTGLVAIVSDSYDIFNACEHLMGEQLHDRIINRDGVLVVRPDSGDPAPTVLALLEILGSKFGITDNSKGFQLLNPHVRMIQGDGVNPKSIRRILDTMKWRRWSADNISFGMGAALLQGTEAQVINRDTCKFAFKCSAIRRGNGTEWDWHDVYKTAIGKQSKRGRLALIQDGGSFMTVPMLGVSDSENQLKDVFLDGDVLKTYPLEEIRQRAEL